MNEVITDPGLRNWIKACLGLKCVRNGMLPYMQRKCEDMYANNETFTKSITKLTTYSCSVCCVKNVKPHHSMNNCPAKVQLGRKTKCACTSKNKKLCPNRGACGVMYDRIMDDHVSMAPRWDNSDCQNWYLNGWEQMKCFIEIPGYKEKAHISQADVTAFVHICQNNKTLYTILKSHLGKLMQVRSDRNEIYHSGDLDITDDKLKEYLANMKAVLNIVVFNAFSSDIQEQLDVLAKLETDDGIEVNTVTEIEARKEALNALIEDTRTPEFSIQKAQFAVLQKNHERSIDRLKEIKDKINLCAKVLLEQSSTLKSISAGVHENKKMLSCLLKKSYQHSHQKPLPEMQIDNGQTTSESVDQTCMETETDQNETPPTSETLSVQNTFSERHTDLNVNEDAKSTDLEACGRKIEMQIDNGQTTSVTVDQTCMEKKTDHNKTPPACETLSVQNNFSERHTDLNVNEVAISTDLEACGRTIDPNLNTAATSKSKGASNQPTRGTPVAGPYVEIVEQPKARGLRFRYKCEGTSAGGIQGASSTPERKTFPAIKIHNHSGTAVIVVSCVTKDEPFKPHPHKLVGKDCKMGVCTLRIRDTATVTFPHLGIQCANNKDVKVNLKLRQEINVDPFQTGFKHKGQNIDLNVVRLCFQVFLPDEQGKITRIVKPVVSQAIHHKKALNDLVICRINRTSGNAKGGDTVFVLCEQINRDDVRVRFYREQHGHVVWEAFGNFGQNDVHRQHAIVFTTPPYMDENIQQLEEVEMQLQRCSDLETSDPIRFKYLPEDPDPDRIAMKRKSKANNLQIFVPSGESGPATQVQLKQRRKLKATRINKPKNVVIIKDEAYSPELPQYSLNNIGAQSILPVMSIRVSQPSFMDRSLPMGSQSNPVSNKLHFNPVTTQFPQVQPSLAQAPQFTLNAQAIQLLMSHGYLNNPQQQAIQSNPVLPQQVQLPVQSQPPIQQDV